MTEATENNNERKSPAWEDYQEAVEQLEKGEIAMAAAGFHNALKDFEAEDDQNGIANAASRLADICLEKEEYSRALDLLARAEKICDAEGDDFSLMSIKTRQAIALRRTGEHRQAINIYLELLETYHTFNNPDGSVKTLEVLSEAYIEAGDRDKAADALKTAASIHRNFGHKRHAAAFEQRAAEILAG